MDNEKKKTLFARLLLIGLILLLIVFWKNILINFWKYLFLLIAIRFIIKILKKFLNEISLILFKKIKIKNYTKKLDLNKLKTFNNYIKDNNDIQKLIFEIINNKFKYGKKINENKVEIVSILKLIEIKNLEFFLNSKSEINLDETFITFVDNHLINDYKFKIFTIDIDLKNKLSEDYVNSFLKDIISGKISLKVDNPKQITNLLNNFKLRDLVSSQDKIPIIFKCMYENEDIDIIEYIPKKFLNEKILSEVELLSIEYISIVEQNFNLFECLRYIYSYYEFENNDKLIFFREIKLNDKNLDDSIIYYNPFTKNEITKFKPKRKHFYNLIRLIFSINYLELYRENRNDFKTEKFWPKTICTFYNIFSFIKEPYDFIRYSANKELLHFNILLKINNYDYKKLILSSILCREEKITLFDSALVNYTNFNVNVIEINYSLKYIYPHEFPFPFNATSPYYKKNNNNNNDLQLINYLKEYNKTDKAELEKWINEGQKKFIQKFCFDSIRYVNYLLNDKENIELINYIAQHFLSFTNKHIIIEAFKSNINLLPFIKNIEYSEKLDVMEFMRDLISLIPNSYINFNYDFKLKFVVEALKNDINNFNSIPEDLKKDILFLKNLIDDRYTFYFLMNKEMKDNKDFILNLVQNNYKLIDIIENYQDLRVSIIDKVYNNIKLLNSYRIKKEFEDHNLLLDLVNKTKKFKDIFNII